MTYYDFGVTDVRGKAMGAYIGQGEYDNTRYSYWFYPQATRAGLSHGPLQQRRYFATEAGRADAVAKYLKAAKARAVRASAKAHAEALPRPLTQGRIAQPEGMVKGLRNCGVVAVAACAGVPYDTAWDLLKGYTARRMGKLTWTGGTFEHERAKALIVLGVAYERLTFKRGQQFRTWARTQAKPGVTYMVTVTGHVVTYKDGVFMDQCGSGPVETSIVGRKQMRGATQIM